MLNKFMNNEMCKEYHDLTNKTDRTKEENRRLEVLKKIAKMQGYTIALDSIAKLDKVNILEYDNVPGLYRIQIDINGRYKTIARVKIAKRDAYILVRETTAKELKKDYEIINYNLPAGYHIEHNLYNELFELVNYHKERQTA